MLDLVGRLYRIQDVADEIDQHFHNIERWWGSTGADDETNAIAATVTVPYQAQSGDNTWGTAIPICGSSDNPVLDSMNEFDAHRILFVDLDDETDAWRLRIIWGTGTSGEAIAADQWSEIVIIANAVPGNRAGGMPMAMRMPPVTIGTKLWAQSWNNTDDEILQFYWGAHGYPYPH